MKKVGISLPDEQFAAVEKIRKKERIPRSRAIQRALDEHLKRLAEAEAVRQYIEGYRRIPEDPAEIAALAKSSAGLLQEEDWT